MRAELQTTMLQQSQLHHHHHHHNHLVKRRRNFPEQLQHTRAHAAAANGDASQRKKRAKSKVKQLRHSAAHVTRNSHDLPTHSSRDMYANTHRHHMMVTYALRTLMQCSVTHARMSVKARVTCQQPHASHQTSASGFRTHAREVQNIAARRIFHDPIAEFE